MPDAVEHALGQQHAHFGRRPRLSSCATASTAGAREPAVGAVDELEAQVREPVLAPLVGELVGVVLVDHEVHGAQLVGPQRAAELHRPGDREVEPVDEHHHDEPACAPARATAFGTSCSSARVFALVLLGQAHEEARP